ncbi:putative membrane protein [Vibrio cholerae HC-51A1]|nr:putative membrane protein [Vibrio cholerae HC-02A1]EJH57933.1 putative membrane protein [Vibrio cholerae HC-43B1]EJH67294.1 putative membrane protein [Vibrio cholerae HE-45]EKG54877.1 putative membrane protein [Vibrio cholerae HC-50A1]EKG60086.1 putative membrane protein [Vibrio cholerae HC-52A1]EKG65176.1 putative membrane protein [Vibrio cholerae HC-56A1]EKG65440.1 putative membrane protein [Vibrio cholerae HC-55A1]EKG74794.1 putative membrane protein [Vibrio cholerae HC-57A1]EKG94651.
MFLSFIWFCIFKNSSYFSFICLVGCFQFFDFFVVVFIGFLFLFYAFILVIFSFFLFYFDWFSFVWCWFVVLIWLVAGFLVL